MALRDDDSRTDLPTIKEGRGKRQIKRQLVVNTLDQMIDGVGRVSEELEERNETKTKKKKNQIPFLTRTVAETRRCFYRV